MTSYRQGTPASNIMDIDFLLNDLTGNDPWELGEYFVSPPIHPVPSYVPSIPQSNTSLGPRPESSKLSNQYPGVYYFKPKESRPVRPRLRSNWSPEGRGSESINSKSPEGRKSRQPCSHPGCPVAVASFNYLDQYPGIFCSKHKEPGMINVRQRLCRHDDCCLLPTYGYPNTKTGLYCRIHRPSGTVNIHNQLKCRNRCCHKRAIFSTVGQTKPTLCFEHKEAGMVLDPSLRCCKGKCTRLPSYANPRLASYLYCWYHRKQGSINISDQKCQRSLCQRKASYGYPATKKPLVCKVHRLTSMVKAK